MSSRVVVDAVGTKDRDHDQEQTGRAGLRNGACRLDRWFRRQLPKDRARRAREPGSGAASRGHIAALGRAGHGVGDGASRFGAARLSGSSRTRREASG